MYVCAQCITCVPLTIAVSSCCCCCCWRHCTLVRCRRLWTGRLLTTPCRSACDGTRPAQLRPKEVTAAVCTTGIPACLAPGKARARKQRSRHGTSSAVVCTAVAPRHGPCSMVYLVWHSYWSGGLGDWAGCHSYEPHPSRMILDPSSLLRVKSRVSIAA